MKFQLRFKRSPHGGHAVHFSPCGVGLDMLDRARSTLNIPKLSATRVSGNLPVFYERDVEVEISENQAINAGQFTESYRITVDVPMESLNRFYHVFENTEIDPTTGEVVQVNWVYQLNEYDLVAAWFDAGCPLKWEPTDTDDEFDAES